MERILTVEQMRSADEYTVNKLGFSREELIKRAGCAVADEIRKVLHGGRVLVCVGKGNNGEDGKVIAQILSKIHGFTVAVISVANGIFKLFDKKFDIIVDCIFGTGLNRNVEGKYKTAIEKINNSGAYVISCDIPSGLNGDTGLVMGTAVKANLTVAIQEYKLGHFLNDGPDYCGKLVVKDIGISIWGEDYAKRITKDEVAKFFENRNRNVNKGCFGKTSVIGGSKGFSGSVLLSANALTSLKMGVGYSNIVVPDCLFNMTAFLNPECILTTVKDDGNNFVFNEKDFEKLLSCDSIAFGMGVGVNEENYKILRYLLSNYEGRLVIDADGLNILSKYGTDILLNKKCEVILTPHIVEFSRLVNANKEEIFENLIKLSMDFANKYGVIVVLKSATTVITDGVELYINTTGCNGMAKAGSGDVLSGFLVGLLTRKFDAFDCAVSACYLFGLSGEIACMEQNNFSMTATDIINSIPKAINSLN